MSAKAKKSWPASMTAFQQLEAMAMGLAAEDFDDDEPPRKAAEKTKSSRRGLTISRQKELKKKPSRQGLQISLPRRDYEDGTRFGQLTVIARDQTGRTNTYALLCECGACGSQRFYNRFALRRRTDPTCGCERLRRRAEKAARRPSAWYERQVLLRRRSKPAALDPEPEQEPEPELSPPVLRGMQFGELTVVEWRKRSFVLCECAACGGRKEYLKYYLPKRVNPTCGCRPLRVVRPDLEAVLPPPRQSDYPEPVITPELAEARAPDTYASLRTNGWLGDGNRMTPRRRIQDCDE